MKNWFANRSLFSATEGALGPSSKKNLGLAKQVFLFLMNVILTQELMQKPLISL